jgi:hypothetical protein
MSRWRRQLNRRHRRNPAHWADPACAYCGGHGVMYDHAPGCHDDLCALAGGFHDCAGALYPCSCTCRRPPPKPDWDQSYPSASDVLGPNWERDLYPDTSVTYDPNDIPF